MGRAILALVILLAIGAAYYLGTRHDAARDAESATDTLERINDADTSEGDPTADDAWTRDFLDRLSRAR